MNKQLQARHKVTVLNRFFLIYFFYYYYVADNKSFQTKAKIFQLSKRIHAEQYYNIKKLPSLLDAFSGECHVGEGGQGYRNHAEVQLASRKKVAKMLIAIVLLFAAFYFPLNLIFVLRSVVIRYPLLHYSSHHHYEHHHLHHHYHEHHHHRHHHHHHHHHQYHFIIIIIIINTLIQIIIVL